MPDHPAAAGVSILPPTGPLPNDLVLGLLGLHHVPGVSLCVMDESQVVWSATYGRRDAGTGRPVDAETRFQVASLTKTLTGLLFMTLVRDGLIDLEAPANSCLSGWRLEGSGADRVTIEMLLSHTGGTSVHGFWGYVPGEPIPSLEQILSGAPPANSEAVRVAREPGTEVVYSGGGTTVLQRLATDVTGKTFGELVRTRVFEPLDMRHSGIDHPPAAGVANLALGHDPAGAVLPGGFRLHPELAAAGLWTTATDFALLLAAIFASLDGKAGALLPSALTHRMTTPVRGDAALGVFSQAPGTFDHGGSNVGYRAHYFADANHGRAIIAMTNGDNGNAIIPPLRQLMRSGQGW
jgi:CubicO group peptidase (beta-lactamase class C family)